MKILAFNGSENYINGVLFDYEVIKQSFDPKLDYSKISFDVIIVLLNSKDDMEIVKFFRSKPQCNPIPIICIMDKKAEGLKKEVIKLGADDYFVTPIDVEELKCKLDSMVKKTGRGCKNLLKIVNPNFFEHSPELNLTNREKEMLIQLSQGLSNIEISKKLCVSEMTVKTHLKNIFKKLNVSNRTEAVLVGLIYDLIGE